MSTPIFIVDDDMVYRYIITRTIQESGIDGTLHEFAAGDDFVNAFSGANQFQDELANASTPAMILLDINMPRMNGFEVLEKLAETAPYNGNFVVFMVTSSNHQDDRAKVKDYQFVKDFVVKPVEPENLKELYENHLT